jgi:hypothetical protein
MVLLSNDNSLNIKNYHMLKCLEKKKTNFNVVVLPLSNNDLKENGSDQDIILYNIPTLSDTAKQLKHLKQLKQT